MGDQRMDPTIELTDRIDHLDMRCSGCRKGADLRARR